MSSPHHVHVISNIVINPVRLEHHFPHWKAIINPQLFLDTFWLKHDFHPTIVDGFWHVNPHFPVIFHQFPRIFPMKNLAIDHHKSSSFNFLDANFSLSIIIFTVFPMVRAIIPPFSNIFWPFCPGKYGHQDISPTAAVPLSAGPAPTAPLRRKWVRRSASAVRQGHPTGGWPQTPHR